MQIISFFVACLIFDNDMPLGVALLTYNKVAVSSLLDMEGCHGTCVGSLIGSQGSWYELLTSLTIIGKEALWIALTPSSLEKSF